MSSSSDSGDLFTSSFRYPDRSFAWAKMTLSDEQIELSGWGWRGRHHRVMRLDEIVEVQWWTGEGSANLALRLQDGAHVELQVEAAGLWKHRIQAQASHLKAPLMRDRAAQKEKKTDGSATAEETTPASQGAEAERAEAERAEAERAEEPPPGRRPSDSPPPQLHVAQPPHATTASSDVADGEPAPAGDAGDAARRREVLTRSYAEANDAPLRSKSAWRAEEVTLVAFCGVLCGAEDLDTLEVYARTRSARLRQLLRLPAASSSSGQARRPPPPQLLTHFLETVRPDAFRRHLACWQRRLAAHVRATGDGRVPDSNASVALDGVEMKAGKNHLVIRAEGQTRAARNVLDALAAFDLSARDVAAVLVPPRQAAPGRLPRYARPHRLARALSEGEARFLMALNGDDPLQQEILDRTLPESALTDEASGAQRNRRCWAADVPENAFQHTDGWPATSVGAVVEETTGDGDVLRQSYLGNGAADAASILQRTRFFPSSSLPCQERDENEKRKTGWKVSVAPPAHGQENRCAENLAHLHDAATMLIEHQSDATTSVRQRRKQAGWDESYLLSILEYALETSSAESSAQVASEVSEESGSSGSIRNLKNAL